jgi:hypothetical protein
MYMLCRSCLPLVDGSRSVVLQRPNNVKELRKSTYVHFREVILLELAKVTVVADDVDGSGDDDAVDELVQRSLGIRSFA